MAPSERHPDPSGLCDTWRARAKKSGMWMAVGSDGKLFITRDFGQSRPCASEREALELWDELREQERSRAKGKPPVWTEHPPHLARTISPQAAPPGVELHLALCQGRFVRMEVNMGSSTWELTGDLSKAHVFASRAAAESAARAAAGASSENPELATLPLLGSFGAPRAVDGHPIDELAGAMAAASARFDIEASTPRIEGEAPRPRPPRV